MPTLHLAVPDAALRGAITEQLALAGLGSVREDGDLAAALGADDAVILLDEAAADKKALKLLRDTAAGAGRKRIFLLGEIKNDGDDSFVTESFPKPLRLGHLLARLQFYLQASRLAAAPVIFGPYRLEAQNRQIVTEKGDIIRLTEKETALLDYLGQNAAAVAREELLAAIWGYDARIDTHTLETHIYQLRRKLDPQESGENWLVNEQGAYRLNRGTASTAVSA